MVEGLTHVVLCLADCRPFGTASSFPSILFFNVAHEGQSVGKVKAVFIAVVDEVSGSRFGIAAEVGDSVIQASGASGNAVAGGGRISVEVHDVYLFSFIFVFPLGTI